MKKSQFFFILFIVVSLDIKAQKAVEIQVPFVDGFYGVRNARDRTNELDMAWFRGFDYAQIGMVNMNRWLVSASFSQRGVRVGNNYSAGRESDLTQHDKVEIRKFEKDFHSREIGIHVGYPVKTSEGFFSISAGLGIPVRRYLPELHYLGGAGFRSAVGYATYDMIYLGFIKQNPGSRVAFQIAHATQVESFVYLRFYATLQWYPMVRNTHIEIPVDHFRTHRPSIHRQTFNAFMFGVGVEITSIWTVKD